MPVYMPVYMDTRDICQKEHDFLTEMFATDMVFKEFAVDYIRGVVDFANALMNQKEERD